MSKKDSEWIIKGLIKKGEINMINYFHDDWCTQLKGGSCNCDPDMQVGQLDPTSLAKKKESNDQEK